MGAGSEDVDSPRLVHESSPRTCSDVASQDLPATARISYPEVLVPRRPPGLAGIFLGGVVDPRVCVVIDYQNIHLTARDLFAQPGRPAHECLIHPLRFAEQVIALRATRQRDETQQRAVLTAVRVFRGSPSNARDPYVYGISQRQRSRVDSRQAGRCGLPDATLPAGLATQASAGEGRRRLGRAQGRAGCARPAVRRGHPGFPRY